MVFYFGDCRCYGYGYFLEEVKVEKISEFSVAVRIDVIMTLNFKCSITGITLEDKY